MFECLLQYYIPFKTRNILEELRGGSKIKINVLEGTESYQGNSPGKKY